MKIIVCNARDAFKRSIKERMQSTVNMYKLHVVSILESHLNDSNAQSFIKSLGRNRVGVSAHSCGAFRGIKLARDVSSIQCQILYVQYHVIHAIIHVDKIGPFLYSSIYASTNPINRAEVWNEMSGSFKSWIVKGILATMQSLKKMA
ncbi:hypothetical protein Cni_G23542 [Canna indica]|uniref:Uncharacterized protein n=1 Tax=Canna indica TaxID=4628 RepID=A0AAQ3QML0_9LILI|nr:hypothetical protein Cni_G23542 [Canna indica]